MNKLYNHIRTKFDPALANSLAHASPIPAEAPVLENIQYFKNG